MMTEGQSLPHVLESRVAWRVLVFSSFIPLLIKTIGYVTIGSYLPLIVFCLFAVLVVAGIRRGLLAEARMVRLWAAGMILWGLVRLGLFLLHVVFKIPEAHIAQQFTISYVLLSLIHVLGGWYLMRGYAFPRRARDLGS
jgi:hypothetical protein